MDDAITERQGLRIWGVWCHATPKDRHNLRVFDAWALAWALAHVGGTFLLVKVGGLGTAATWTVAAFPVLLGLGALVAYVRFLKHADELLRRIQLEGLALGFGVGVLFMLSYQLAERAGAPHLGMSMPVLVMVVFWALGQWLGARRYA